MVPPPLYDLTELQRHANRLFGFSAQQTLDVAQALYERHKLISYPRTDSRHLSQDVAVTLPRIIKAIAAPYQAHLAPGTEERLLGRRFVDDAKVTDHHAIIPTTTPPGKATTSEGPRHAAAQPALRSFPSRFGVCPFTDEGVFGWRNAGAARFHAHGAIPPPVKRRHITTTLAGQAAIVTGTSRDRSPRRSFRRDSPSG